MSTRGYDKCARVWLWRRNTKNKGLTTSTHQPSFHTMHLLELAVKDIAAMIERVKKLGERLIRLGKKKKNLSINYMAVEMILEYPEREEVRK